MNEIYEKKLHESVCNFKKWAQINYPEWKEENDNGEWELGIDEFEEMCRIILEIIENISYRKATEKMIDDILFGIARDNECSIIVETLLDHSEWYSVLCRKCLNTNYINAKWQFAESLKEYRGNDDLQETIFKFSRAVKV